MRRFLSILLLLTLCARGLFAAAPIEDVSFANEELKARYLGLIDVLRCPKCQNVNLAGSDAPIAALMREEIREQLAEGRSDEEIKAFFVARYGDFVLYKPPLDERTVLLWFGPFLLLIGGFFILWRVQAAARSEVGEDALSAEEMQKLKAMLDDSKDGR